MNNGKNNGHLMDEQVNNMMLEEIIVQYLELESLPMSK